MCTDANHCLLACYSPRWLAGVCLQQQIKFCYSDRTSVKPPNDISLQVWKCSCSKSSCIDLLVLPVIGHYRSVYATKQTHLKKHWLFSFTTKKVVWAQNTLPLLHMDHTNTDGIIEGLNSTVGIHLKGVEINCNSCSYTWHKTDGSFNGRWNDLRAYAYSLFQSKAFAHNI